MADNSQAAAAAMPDAALISAILAGEQRLFETIMRRYNQRLYRVGMSILGHDMETEDAMQAAYINAYEHLAQFENRASFGTWLTRIMINQCYEQKRKRPQTTTYFGFTEKFINMKTPANLLANKELNNVLEEAIAALPEKYRLVFVLREIDDLSVKETAEILTIEETNVKVRLNRAKAMLRTHLTGYMKDHVYSYHLTRCNALTNNVLNHLQIS